MHVTPDTISIPAHADGLSRTPRAEYEQLTGSDRAERVDETVRYDRDAELRERAVRHVERICDALAKRPTTALSVEHDLLRALRSFADLAEQGTESYDAIRTGSPDLRQIGLRRQLDDAAHAAADVLAPIVDRLRSVAWSA